MRQLEGAKCQNAPKEITGEKPDAAFWDGGHADGAIAEDLRLIQAAVASAGIRDSEKLPAF